MKKVLIGLLVVAALVVVAARFKFSGAIEGAIEASTGVPVKIGRVTFGVFPLRFGARDIKLKNPQDFKEKWLAVVPEIAVTLGGWDLKTKTVTVKEVRVDLESVTLERNGKGQVNAIELKKKLDEKASRLPPASPKNEKKPEGYRPPPNETYQVQIDRAVVSMGSVAYVDYNSPTPQRTEFKLNLKEKVLEDVSNPVALTEQILTLALERIGLSVLESNFEKIAADAKASLERLFQ